MIQNINIFLIISNMWKEDMLLRIFQNI